MNAPDVDTKSTILIVDDSPDNLALMSALLKPVYHVQIANNGERALKLVSSGHISGKQPDLILLDIMMPVLDGYEVCRRLKADPSTHHIPVIFLTAKTSIDNEKLCFDLGAADFITKPISPPVVLARVKKELELKNYADFLQNKAHTLEVEVVQRTQEVAAIQDVTIHAMASLAETRDPETGNHIRRTQLYVRALATRLQHHPRFARYLTPANITLLFKSAPLHDIGKVGIPDRILLKPGRLEPSEFEIMKTHTTLGYRAIAHGEKSLGMTVEFLTMVKEIALSHHEKWDGSGYPQGLIGNDIPISARLMAIADVYDALISRRIYKEGMPHDQAVTVMLDGKSLHFDPDITLAFLAIQEDFRQIALQHADSDQDFQEKARYLNGAAESARTT
ncbi:response regulator [Candidatus Symbiobacter mobilis]|uniref:Response regulator-like protein n=1 Tax=Candidatus Symbiobacter mobilis CR TaxID=946483 RepID=U5N8V7_9BURK|nr:two-component system response regulator [Candidatus Symbiobacter mobilis]AGX87971.1 response regulator-like protein [Candidatus Symbiobacter mobilis CR]